MEECIGFAEKSGMLKGKELEEAKKFCRSLKAVRHRATVQPKNNVRLIAPILRAPSNA